MLWGLGLEAAAGAVRVRSDAWNALLKAVAPPRAACLATALYLNHRTEGTANADGCVGLPC